MSPRRIDELTRRERRHAVVASLVRGGCIAVILVALYYITPAGGGTDTNIVLRIILGLGLFAALLAWQVRRIVQADIPQLRLFEALATVLPFFLVLFARTYLTLSHTNPGSFTETLTHSSALYFVVVVFGTVGFGDIAPRTDTARLIVSMQILLDLVLIGAILRLLLTAVEKGLTTPENDDGYDDDDGSAT